MKKRTYTKVAWFKAPVVRENFQDFGSYSWQEPIPTFLKDGYGCSLYITKIVATSYKMENGFAGMTLAFSKSETNDYKVSQEHLFKLKARLEGTNILCERGWDNNYLFKFKVGRRQTFTEAAIENALALVDRLAVNLVCLNSPPEVTQMTYVLYEGVWMAEGYYLAHKHGIVNHLPS